MTDDQQNRWSVDRRIPLAAVIGFVCASLGTGAGAAVAAGRLAQRVDSLEQAATTTKEDHDRLITIQAQVAVLNATLNRMETRQIERMQRR